MADKYYRASMYVTLPDGTKKQLRFTGKTQKEADKKRDRALVEYEAGLLVTNGKTTLRDWYTDWLETYKAPKVQDSTLGEIKGIFERVYLPHIGGVALSDLRPVHIQKCLNTQAGKSESYIHRCMIYMKDCVNKAPEGSLKYNPIKGLEKPRVAEKIPRRPLTEREKELFLRCIAKHRKGDFFGIMYACGLRPQEARALPVFNVNLKDKTIKVSQAIEEGTQDKVKTTKTQRGNRIIPIPDWYVAILAASVKKAVENGSPYVFYGENNKVLCTSTVYRCWNSLMRMMDIAAGAKLYRNKITIHALDQDLDPYNLRHTYCTELAEKGVDLKTAQYLMGHKDIRVTAEIYTHITDNMLDVAREKINSKKVVNKK